jgi:hypothetical protein
MNFKNKMRLFSLMILLIGSVAVMAKPVIVLSDNQEDYTQTQDGYVLNFDLEATASELAIIESRITPLSDRVNMTSNFVTENNYKCVFTVTHQNQPEYVHKMLLSCGFQVIKHKGQTFGLNEIITILYSYQN